ncbi:hypothetical protein [Scytonema sp. NUACC21]
MNLNHGVAFTNMFLTMSDSITIMQHSKRDRRVVNSTLYVVVSQPN